ncbi:MAG: hypothetical protein RLZZ502_362, partial [Pseudomonadota bacterium]
MKVDTEIKFNRRSSDKSSSSSNRAQYRALPVAVYAPPPDWRNLGILARSLILIVLGVIVVALVASDSGHFWDKLAQYLAYAMWPIFAVLTVASASSPYLAKLARWQWMSILLAVAGLSALALPATDWFVRFKHVFIAGVGMGAVMMYLDLRGKAFSP